jgi:hypothetical protein
MPFKAKRLARRVGKTFSTTSRKGIKTLAALARAGTDWSAASKHLQGSVKGQGMYTGYGAYKPKKKRKRLSSGAKGPVSNSLIAGSDIMIPSFTSAGNETGGITISRKEYLGDVFAPAATSATEIPSFTNTTYAINPGVERSFPWLSQIAQNFEEYTLHQLIYTFRTTITDVGNSRTGQCGTIVMCTRYNVGNAPFDDKVSMMEYEGAMSAKATDSMLHGVECDPNKLSGNPGKYVRCNGFANGNQDTRDYDHGLFQIAVANPPYEYASQTLGELWVTYTISLRKPKFFVGRGFGISQDLYLNMPSTSQLSIVPELPMGDAGLARQYLTAELNNLRTILQPVFQGALATSPGFDAKLNAIQAVVPAFTRGLKITFPANVTGFFEVTMSMRMRSAAPASAAGGHSWAADGTYGNSYWWSPDRTLGSDPKPTINGNIDYVKDIYGGPLGVISLTTNVQPSSYEATPSAGSGNGVYRFHIQVRPASGKQPNYVLIVFAPGNLALGNPGTTVNSGAIMSCQVSIQEYNAAFSYRTNNIGPEAPAVQSQDVIYVDTLGNRVVPYKLP